MVTRTCRHCDHRGRLLVVAVHGTREYVCDGCGEPFECDECGHHCGPGDLCEHQR